MLAGAGYLRQLPIMITSLKPLLRRIIRPHLHKPEVNLPYTVLGTEYGGWPLLTDQTPRAPLIYSFGVGEDISFDVAAINKFHATVHAFDPTPRSLTWIGQQNLPAGFHFHPVGVAAEDGEAEFFAPEVSGYVSYSSQPAAKSDRGLAVKAPVKRFSTLIAELDTVTPDMVKFDIEGFEYAVLDDIIDGSQLPGQLSVEFHHRMYDIPTTRTIEQIERLRNVGYRIFYVSESGHEYGLVHNKLMSGM